LDDVLTELNVIREGDSDNYLNNPTPSSAPNRYATSSGEPLDPEDPRGGKHTLIEYWYRKYLTRYFLYDIQNGRLSRYDTEVEAQKRIDDLMAVYKAPVNPLTGGPMMDAAGAPMESPDPEALAVLQRMKPIARVVPEMWVCAVTQTLILAEGRSPLEPRYHDFPFFPFYAEWYPSAETEALRIKGVVRDLKDPQKEVNKARSQFLHILNTSANSGWVGDSDALGENEWNDLQQFGSRPGYIIKVTPGAKLERVHPVEASMPNILREKTATENLKEVSGLNADLLAMEDKTVSGKALAMRIKQALTIVAGMFENWKHTKQLVGEAIFKLLPEVMDAKKLANICGQTWMQTSGVGEGKLAAMLSMIEDGKYDVYIADAADSPTLRGETFEQLMEMQTAGIMLPPDLLLTWSNIPNANEVIQQVQQYQAQQQAMAAASAKPTPT
jgi:hypothetical protein